MTVTAITERGERSMRLIDADAMIEDLATKGVGFARATVDPRYKTIIDWAIRVTKAQPTIEERKTGRWIPQNHNKVFGNITTCLYYYPVCSGCGHTGDFNMNYCPNCGARMEVERETD